MKIGTEINGWIIKDVVNEYRTRPRKYYVCKCTNCNKERKIRSDKIKDIVHCSCNADINKNKIYEKHINEEWGKIKDSNICDSKEQMIKEYFSVPNEKSFYRKNANRPYSKENYIFGTYNDLQKFYEKEKLQRLQEKKENLNEQVGDKIRMTCEFCGYIGFWNLKYCPHCGESSNAFYNADNREKLKEENNNYTGKTNKLLFDENGRNNYIVIDDLPANYIEISGKIKRIGIISINYIDYKNQGVIGNFQAVTNKGNLIIIKNVFQHFNELNMFLINKCQAKKDYIHIYDKGDTYIYPLIIKKNGKYEGHIISEEVDKYICDTQEFWNYNDNYVYLIDSENKYFRVSIESYNIERDIFSGLANANDKELIQKRKESLAKYGLIENIDEKGKNNLKSFNNPKVAEAVKSIVDIEQKNVIYFNKIYTKNSYMLYELLNQNCITERIDNEFDDDNTINYKGIIDKEDYEILDSYYCLISEKSNPLNFYAYNYCIYGYPLFRIFRNFIIDNKKEFLKLIDENIKEYVLFVLEHLEYEETNISKYKKIIEKLQSKYNLSTIELVKVLLKKYGTIELLGLYYLNRSSRYGRAPRKTIKDKMIYIYDSIYGNDEIKWKSEFELYSMLKFYYPDSIYQYKDDRFMGLIIDVYVPSISTAFEYQGEQHYKENKYFEGSLQERQANDKLKKEICLKYNINLIEWKYNEPINKMILDEKLSTNKK